MSPLLLDPSEVSNLAPSTLNNFRDERYRGGSFTVSVSDFSDDEQAVLTSHYELHLELFSLLNGWSDLSEEERGERTWKLVHFVRQNQVLHLSEQLQDLIREAEDERDGQKVRILRRLSSGAFTSIAYYMMLIRSGGLEPEYVQNLFYLIRDHLKSIRSFVQDIDVERRARDEAVIHHSMDLLLEKWESSTYRAFGDAVHVNFNNLYDGVVAERCIEFAEIDRVFYQLTNFAVEHAVDGQLGVTVAKLDDGQSLRWVFAMNLSRDDQSKVRGFRESGLSLFEHEYEPEGAPFTEADLSFVGEAVAHAYGLPDLLVAEDQGYIGSQLQGDRLVIWFHWPVVGTV